MAAIDAKVRALDFVGSSGKSLSELHQLFADAAEVTQGGKVALTKTSDTSLEGVVRNWMKIQLAAFAVMLDPSGDGRSRVAFNVGQYMRTRESVLFIPISPWTAPAYKSLRVFSDYARTRL